MARIPPSSIFESASSDGGHKILKQGIPLRFTIGFLCFALGFFVGREELRYELQIQMQRTFHFPTENSIVNRAIKQASAVGSLRTITSAESSYFSTYKVGFSPTLAALGPPPNPPENASGANLIDDILASGTKEGYRFTYGPGPTISGAIKIYSVRADPAEPESGGYNHYYADQTGVIRENKWQQAGPNDPPIGD